MSYFALGWEELARSLVWLGCSWCRKYKMPFCLMKSYSRTTGKPLPDLQLKLNVSTECQYFHHLVLRSLFNNISGSRGRTNYIANTESGKKRIKTFFFQIQLLWIYFDSVSWYFLYLRFDPSKSAHSQIKRRKSRDILHPMSVLCLMSLSPTVCNCYFLNVRTYCWREKTEAWLP